MKEDLINESATEPNQFIQPDSPLVEKKVAIVCDWLNDWGGAEQVLLDILDVFPNAHIYTSVFFPKQFPMLQNKTVITSFLQRIPFVRTHPKMFPFLRPYAFESFDFSGYDLVISSSSAESKGILTGPDTIHICYCHSPTRYYWSHYHEYISKPEFGWMNFLARLVMPLFIHRLRIWDRCAADRVDAFIANSHTTELRIAKYYRTKSEVITPGIDSELFPIETEREDYYLALGRIVAYKRFDLLVDTFNKNGKSLKIVTSTENALFKELIARSNDNIEWIVGANNEEKVALYQKAKALIFPQEEDFGLVPIEAMLTGTPVIAYAKGGALETVREDLSGIFFEEQTVESLENAIERFERERFSAYEIRKYALKFDRTIFQERLVAFLEQF